MKKIGILWVTLIILSLAVMQVFAAEAVCSVDGKITSLGDKISVTVSLHDCVNVKTMGITPVYDKNSFDLVSAKWTVKGSLIDDFDEVNGNGVILFASAKDCNGEIFKFELKAKDGIASAQYKLSARMVIKDGNNKDVECSSPEITLTVDKKAELPSQGETAAVTKEAEDSTSSTLETKETPENTHEIVESQRPEESISPATQSGTEANQTSPEAPSESQDVPQSDEYIGEEVPYPAEPDLLNKNTVLWIVVAVVGCIVVGVCLASFKKRK